MKGTGILGAVLLVMAFCIVVSGCGQKGEGTASCHCGITNWVAFSPGSGSFSVLLPFQPKESHSTKELKKGTLVLHTYTAAPTANVAFSVVQTTLSEKADVSHPDLMLQAGLKGAVKDGRLISQTNITVHGYPALEYKIQRPNKQHIVMMRQCIADHDIYAMVCVMKESQFCEKHAREFLDSFDVK